MKKSNKKIKYSEFPRQTIYCLMEALKVGGKQLNNENLIEMKLIS